MRFSMRGILVFAVLVAISCGWYRDRLQLKREILEYKLDRALLSERLEIIGEKDWTDNEHDLTSLLRLLGDQIPNVSWKAENQLRRLYPGVKPQFTNAKPSRLERMIVWSQILVDQKSVRFSESNPDHSHEVNNFQTGVFDPDPFGDGTFSEEMDLPEEY